MRTEIYSILQKMDNKCLLASEPDVHYAVLAQSTCLKTQLDNYKVLAYYSQQKAPPYCPSSFFSEEALEGVPRVVPSVFSQTLKYTEVMYLGQHKKAEFF